MYFYYTKICFFFDICKCFIVYLTQVSDLDFEVEFIV